MVGLERISCLAIVSRHLPLSGRPEVVLRTNQNRARKPAIAVAENLSRDYADEIDAHFDFMPDNYFRATDVPEIVEHLKLFRSFLESISSVEGFRLLQRFNGSSPGARAQRLSFCTWERERLLAKIAGSFSVVPINILSADVFPRGDNVVLSVFRVCDTKAACHRSAGFRPSRANFAQRARG